MYIYIISDNIYFTKGLSEVISNNIGSKTINLTHDNYKHLRNNIKLSRQDVIFTNFNCKESMYIKGLDYIVKCEIKNQFPRFIIAGNDNITPSISNSLGYNHINYKSILSSLKSCIYEDNKNLNESENKLSLKEKFVLAGILKGTSTHALARRLGISIKTVSSHKINALRKLGFDSINRLYAHM